MPKIGESSPWGAIDHVQKVAGGIEFVSTASHGGFWVAPYLMAAIPADWRTTPYSPGNWFEQDCDWCFVALTFPAAFNAADIEKANKTIAWKREHGFA